MDPRNTTKLVTTFPNLYATTKWFECGDGWFDLLWKLSEDLERLIIANDGAATDWGVSMQASQVKEKYGTLCFYMNFATDEMFSLINQAIEASRHICETCGNPGNISKSYGWYSVRCSEHMDPEASYLT